MVQLTLKTVYTMSQVPNHFFAYFYKTYIKLHMENSVQV